MSSQLHDTQKSSARDEGLARYLTEEFLEDYQQGRLSRREALKRLAGVVGSMVLAESLIAACAPAPQPTAPTASSPTSAAPSSAPTTASAPAPGNADILADMIEYPGRDATLLGYLARPIGPDPKPVVLVCHENRGLNAHTEDVARRFAKEGYVALAVDLLAREGGRAKISDESQVPGLLGNMPGEQLVDDFYDALRFLQDQEYVDPERVGMTGFCFGGGVTWRCATQIPELKAAVPFYGASPPLEDVPKIQAAVLAIYGEAEPAHYLGRASHRKGTARRQQDVRHHHLPTGGPRLFQRHRRALQR